MILRRHKEGEGRGRYKKRRRREREGEGDKRSNQRIDKNLGTADISQVAHLTETNISLVMCV